MLNQSLNSVKAVLFALTLSLFLTGCAGNRVSTQKMLEQTKDFDLPYKPKSNKALVYFIDQIEAEALYPVMVDLYYTKSTKARHSKDNSKAFGILNVFTFGLAEDKPLSNKKRIGTVYPGRFRIKYFEPGYYEFNRVLKTQVDFIRDTESVTQMRLEPGHTYFVKIYGASFYNRYSNEMCRNIYIREEKDSLKGKYTLKRNFKEMKD